MTHHPTAGRGSRVRGRLAGTGAATLGAVVLRRRRARGNACATVAPGPVPVELGGRPDQPEGAEP